MNIEDQIENLLQNEIMSLRDLLANIKQEQDALKNKNQDLLAQVFEERLDYLELIEKFDEQLFMCMHILANERNLPDVINNSLEQQTAFNLLKSLITDDDITIATKLHQIASIIEEIQHQNNITKNFLLGTGRAVDEVSTFNLIPKEQPQPKPAKKIILALMEPPDFNQD